MEVEPVSADPQRCAGRQRAVGAPVGVGRRGREQAARARPDLVQDNLDARRRPAGDGVEHMGGEAPVGRGFSRPVDLGDEAQPGDEADLVDRRGKLVFGIVPRAALETVEDRMSRVCRRTQMMNGNPKRA